MNDSQLIERFWQVLEDLPQPAPFALKHYFETNGIKLRIGFSDEHVNHLEAKLGRRYPAAVGLLAAPFYWFMFRNFVAESPAWVVDTLLRHEIIHAFLSPYFVPDSTQAPAMKISFEEITSHAPAISAIIAEKSKSAAWIEAREEPLIAQLNMEWGGGDEGKVTDWLRERVRKVPNAGKSESILERLLRQVE